MKLSECIKSLFPSIRVDEKELDRTILRMKTAADSFYRETEHGAIIAYTDELPFSTKKQSVLAVWMGSGDGVKLFKEWMGWVRGRKSIRLASFTPMFDDSRLDRFMRHNGFRRIGGMYVWER